MMVANAFASTHLVKLSIPMTRNLSYRIAIGKGPMMLSPHWVKGHGDLIRVSCSNGYLITLLKHWHLSHAFT